MDWGGLMINVIAVFIGLALYLGVSHTRWGQEHAEYQYAIMLAVIIIVCLAAWGLRVLFGVG